MQVIYIYEMFILMKCKKQIKKIKFPVSLSRALTIALGKEIWEKILRTFFAEGREGGPRQRRALC